MYKQSLTVMVILMFILNITGCATSKKKYYGEIYVEEYNENYFQEEKKKEKTIKKTDIKEKSEEAKINFKIGFDFYGNHKREKSTSVMFSTSLMGELAFLHFDILGLGLGIEYQFPRTTEGSNAELGFVSFCGLIRPTIPFEYGYLYIAVLWGLNAINENKDYEELYGYIGDLGACYGFEGGMVFHKFLFELKYFVNTDYLFSKHSDNLEYSRFTFSIGYSL